MTSQHRGLRLGTTLYSLTDEFHDRKYTFEELIRKVSKDNLGPGLEVVGFQSIRGFPKIEEQFADQFKKLIDETGLVPSCLSINADLLIDPDRPMTDDESVHYHALQIEAAAKLGFPVVRYQFPAGTEVIRRLVPIAEKFGVKLGLEIHAPHHVHHPVILAYREMYEKINSPFLGFIPDMGASASTVPPGFFDAEMNRGVSSALIELAKSYWHDDQGDPFERQAKFKTRAEELKFTPSHINNLLIIFNVFGKQDPSLWAEIIPQSVHIHGKFFDFDENGNEVAIDYKTIIPVFVKNGYNGFMSSEYEGNMWTDADGFNKLHDHHKLLNRILSNISH